MSSSEAEQARVNRKYHWGLFSSRNFLDYFWMYLTSRSAFQVASVGLIWLVYAVTRSALDVAVVGVSNTISTLVVTLPAGVWVDRVDRRMLLLISNAASVVSVLVLAVLSLSGSFDLALVVIIVVIWAAAGELYRSTSYAVLPDIILAKELPNANGITQSGYQIVNSISTVLGGALIVAAGVVFTFIYGVLGYGLSAIFSAFLLYRFRAGGESKRSKLELSSLAQKTEVTNTDRRSMVREIKEGFSWLVTQRGLLALSLLALVFNFVFGIPTYFLVIYVTNALKAGALLYGGILAAFAAGGASGSLLSGRLPNSIAYAGKINILLWGALGGGLLIVLGLFPSGFIALVGTFVIGLGLGFGNNVWLTSSQNLVPTEMRGRYFAIDGLLSFIGGPPSIAVGGILITFFGISQVFVLSGAILLVFALIFALIKSLWILDGRSDESKVDATAASS
jgi:MFS family permease